MTKKHIVDLDEGEKVELVALTQKGRPGARKIKRANILLLANAGKSELPQPSAARCVRRHFDDGFLFHGLYIFPV